MNKDMELLSTKETCDFLQITRQKLYKLIRNGKLPAINTGSGSKRNDWKIKKADAVAFLEHGTTIVTPVEDHTMPVDEVSTSTASENA